VLCANHYSAGNHYWLVFKLVSDNPRSSSRPEGWLALQFSGSTRDATDDGRKKASYYCRLLVDNNYPNILHNRNSTHCRPLAWLSQIALVACGSAPHCEEAPLA
jgi:hypothetical protein